MRISPQSRRTQKDASPSQARPATSEPTAEESREPQKRITVGLNFASSATSASYSGAGNPEPKSVTFGEAPVGPGGLSMAAYKLPTNVKFLEPGRFRTLGHEMVIDMDTTSSGAKQSMDENLCTPGSEGDFFLKLCDKYGVCKWDVIRQLLADAFHYIQLDVKRALGKDDSDTLEQNDWTVTNAVPMIWTGGGPGLEIQKQFARCMEEVGYPTGNKIICEDESILTKAWVERGNKKLSNLAVDPEATQGYADVGACTMDLAFRFVWFPNTLLAGKAVGCAGGMADFWRWLHVRCDHNSWMFKVAATYVHHLTPDFAEDFTCDSHTIALDEIREKLGKVFEAPLALIETMIKNHRRLIEFTVSGEAPTSNAYIRDMFATRIGNALTEAGMPECQVVFIKAEDASLAVSKGAAIPYDEDPRLRFWERCFGIRLHMCSEQGDCATTGPCKREETYVAQLKGRKSWKLANWVHLPTNGSNGHSTKGLGL
ncbi:uncharacterized protein LMH87_007707 [Akanthomyces muscarius]|uniref:Uncharacterized protein n=1 Tax=Akanthomyces muscarius TaxID=2231603 RepID=A0A9W8UQ26_AKAMU|nr:uncharacterized protein LMH87_007707 [Akanthomyces muscarius]KAJ4161682.1 hypothetical protein LMH87_007707 [Akanthomyces muscarius]